MQKWGKLLAYVSGQIDQELLFANQYLAAENHILRAQLPTELRFSDSERSTLAERLASASPRKALAQLNCVAKPETIRELRRILATVRDEHALARRLGHREDHYRHVRAEISFMTFGMLLAAAAKAFAKSSAQQMPKMDHSALSPGVNMSR